jgi:uncharacterized protein
LKQVVEYGRSIEKLGHQKFSFELCTNCTLLDKEVTDFIVKERFLLFMSIDGWREMHNYNRPSLEKDDMYDLIVANAKYAHDQFVANGLGSPKLRANLTDKYHDWSAVGRYLEGLGFNNVQVGLVEPLPHEDKSPAALSEDQADEVNGQYIDMIVGATHKVGNREPLSKHLAILFNKSVKALEKIGTAGIECGVCRNTLVVDNKGGLFPCHRYEGMEAYKMGDVFTGLDKQKVMKYYRQLMGHSLDHCADCWIRDYCGGGCGWLLSSRKGEIVDPTPRECDRRSRGTEISLWARSQLRKTRPDLFRSEAIPHLDDWSWVPPENAPTCRTIPLSVISEH